MRLLLPRFGRKKTHLSSLLIKDLLRSCAYNRTKIVILKNMIDNIRAIKESSFNHLYIVGSFYFILINISKMSIFFN